MIEMYVNDNEVVFVKREYEVRDSNIVLVGTLTVRCSSLNNLQTGLMLKKLSYLKIRDDLSPKDFGEASSLIKSVEIGDGLERKVPAEVKVILKLLEAGKDPHPSILSEMLGQDKATVKKLLEEARKLVG